MNVCSLSGRILKNATSRGSEPKTLSFVLETKYGYNDDEQKERLTYAPCVLFNPSAQVEKLLTTQGEGLFVELDGRVGGPHPESLNGRKFGAEVIVRKGSLSVRDSVPD
jgi:hypothetical protein